MKELSLAEIKNIELQLLLVFANYCDSHNLRYFLCGGTALGAIRHKGFIPWDDDIDVMMPRKHYERFLADFQNDKYNVVTCYNQKQYGYPFAKLVDKNTRIFEKSKHDSNIGVYIDVFPIEDLPDSNIHIRFIYWIRTLFRTAMFCKTSREKKRSFVKTIGLEIGRAILSPISLNCLAKAYDRFSKRNRKNKKINAGKIEWGYGLKEVMPYDMYDKCSFADFEGHSFKVPSNVDLYLTRLFGNYMKLPPEDKRVITHGMKAYLLENEGEII